MVLSRNCCVVKGVKDMKSPARRRVKFTVTAEPGSKVCIAGSFNNWNPAKTKLTEKKGVFSKSVLLEPGRYEYKFVINGIWTVDPECADWVPNGHGSLNSVVEVS